MMRLLVIDSDPNARARLRAVLTEAGYDVHAAEDAEAGLAAFDRHPAPVVIVDPVTIGHADASRLVAFLKRYVGVRLISGAPGLRDGADAARWLAGLGIDSRRRRPVGEGREGCSLLGSGTAREAPAASTGEGRSS